MNHTQVFNSTAGDLVEWLKWTRRQEGQVVRANEWITIRNVGGLELNDSSPEDEQNTESGPGVLVEGVTLRDTDTGPEVVITIWAGGSMHDLVEDPDMPLTGRVVRENGYLNPTKPIPKFDSCWACSTTFVPGDEEISAHHAACFE